MTADRQFGWDHAPGECEAGVPKPGLRSRHRDSARRALVPEGECRGGLPDDGAVAVPHRDRAGERMPVVGNVACQVHGGQDADDVAAARGDVDDAAETRVLAAGNHAA